MSFANRLLQSCRQSFASWRLDDLRWAERLVCEVVLAFALWTAICHAVVFSGGSLRTLIALFALAAIAVLILRLGFGRSTEHEPTQNSPESLPAPPWLRWALVAAGIAAALLWGRSSDDFVLAWYTTAAILGLATLYFLIRPGESEPHEDPLHRGPSSARAPASSRHASLALLALAISCAAFSLIAHGSNADDAFYVSLAVAEVEDPTSPLIDGDPMHGVEGLPLYIPIYRVHSFEMLCAAISYVTGIPTLAVFHLLAAAFGSFLLPLAYAALLRRLVPAHWLLATFVMMIVLIAPGDAIRWYGNLAFFRMWQGKSLFLALMTPLLYLFALRFAARRTVASWLDLVAAQVAAVGLTSTAFFAAPVAVTLGLCVGLRRSWKSLGPLVAGVLSSSYLVVLGLGLKKSVVGSVNPPPPLSSDERIFEVFTLILGAESSRLWMISFAAVAIAWALVPPGLARRFALIVPAGAWFIFINPHFGGWVMAHVTHRQHWRSMWALPLPILIAFLCLAPLFIAPGKESLTPNLRRGLSLLATLLFAVFIPHIHGPSATNGITFKAPGLKVPESYAHAKVVSEAFGPGTLVAAPPDINIWLPTFHDRVRPLAVRFYLRRMASILGEDELKKRDFIPRLLLGDTEWPGAPRALGQELECFTDIQGVVLPPSKQRASYRQTLEAIGFSRLPSAEAEALDLDLWQRVGSQVNE